MFASAAMLLLKCWKSSIQEKQTNKTRRKNTVCLENACSRVGNGGCSDESKRHNENIVLLPGCFPGSKSWRAS